MVNNQTAVIVSRYIMENAHESNGRALYAGTLYNNNKKGRHGIFVSVNLINQNQIMNCTEEVVQ